MASITLTGSNVLNPNTGVYSAFASKVVAYVFKEFTGLERVNGELIGNIVSIPNTSDSPDLVNVSTYGSGLANWSIPSNHMGKFTYSGLTYYVVFGYIDPAGTRQAISGSASSSISIQMDDTYLTNNFKLTGCKLVGLCSRSDCGIVASYFNISGNATGEIPITALS